MSGVPEGLPEGLPAPEDDGAAAHLPGLRIPPLVLQSTEGELRLDRLASPAVVFVHPSIGGIDAEALEEWSAIPGARGCTPEACAFRDELGAFGVRGTEVMGLSAQAPSEQRAAVGRLALSYPLISDPDFALAGAIEVPSFEFRGRRYYKRLTLIVSAQRIEAALYPVFPPDAAAQQALAWLRARS